MKENLLDLFYNYVVKEAATGRVDCFMIYNLIFQTKVPEYGIEVLSEVQNDNLMIPTLVIRNVREFEGLLLEYVEKALEFYEDEDFYEEIRNSNFRDNEMGVSKEKLIMTLLWSNATIEDFNDPCAFLRKRIAFFEIGDFNEFLHPQIINHSEVLGGNLEVKILKNRLEHETPYSMQMFLRSDETGDKIYEFPTAYFGIFNNTGYVYAIQNSRDRFIHEKYEKKISRKLYSVDEGFDVHEDNYDNYDIGNLKDITPSFLLMANVLMGLLHEHGISKVQVASILVSRWNAKIIALVNQEKRLRLRGLTDKEIFDELDTYYEQYIKIQSNLTEKFLRIFRRLGYHHSSIGIFNQPMEGDSNLVLHLFKGEDVCNNELLLETYSVDLDKKVSKR